MSPRFPIILVLGPTASGKTRLSVELAQRLDKHGGGECLSADSMQVYRGMDIGTAKPTLEERGGVPHHLVDLVDPSDDGFTVDAWLAAADATIAAVRERERFPIVVGGTNLYVQALLEGLFEGPEPDAELRQRLEREDPADLRARLERVDPAAAARIHANDLRRTVRAIEVFELTGQPLSERQRQWGAGPREDIVIIGLDWPVDILNRRINDRVRAMVAAGLVEEVRGLWKTDSRDDRPGGRLGVQAREALGYRQIIDYLEGRCGIEEAIEQIKIRTRRFGKQQRTWLRRFRTISRSTWIRPADLTQQDLVHKALVAIDGCLPTPPPGADPAGRRDAVLPSHP